MSQYYPSEKDVTNDSVNHDNVMHKTPFMKKCEEFFGFHREFMNKKQVASEDFCKHWNIEVNQNSALVTCYYSKPKHQSSKKAQS